MQSSVPVKNNGVKVQQKPSFSSVKPYLIPIAVLLVCALIIGGIAAAIYAKNDRCAYVGQRDIEGHEIVYVEMSVKDYGVITLMLDKTTAPITVENFVKLVNEGFYDGLTFHRIISDFMIQGGDPTGTGSGGSDEEIVGEFAANGHANNISHINGVISMARSNAYNSASSQFFICNADSRHLDGEYAAFGYVTKGLHVVQKITKNCVKYTNTKNGVIYNKANQPVIEYIRVIE